MTWHPLLRICLTALLTLAIPGGAFAGATCSCLGPDTPAIYRDGPNRFYLTDRFDRDPAALQQNVKWKPGGATYTGLAGDWNGNALDTVGAYNPALGTFHLKSNNKDGDNSSLPNFRFRLANPPIGTPLTCDEATGKFFIRDTLTSGAVDTQVKFKVTNTAGLANIIALCGDWNNDGIESFGLYDKANGKFFLTNDNAVFPALPASRTRRAANISWATGTSPPRSRELPVAFAR